MRYLLLILLVGCGFPPLIIEPPPAGPPECSAGAHDWNAYHWPSDGLLLTAVDRTAGAYDVPSHGERWSSLGTPIQFGAGGVPVEVIVGGDLDDGWLGLASVKLDWTGHIKSARVTMNTLALDRANLGLAARNHVLCQELGHILGLDHNRDALDTCMNDCVGQSGRAAWVACLSGADGTTPNPHDAELLEEKYAHSDGRDTPPVCQGWWKVHTFPGFEAPDHH